MSRSQIWDRNTLECVQVLTGHTGSVLCLQYDENNIISGSSDSTVRVWNATTGEMVNTLIHHCEAVLHLRFCNGNHPIVLSKFSDHLGLRICPNIMYHMCHLEMIFIQEWWWPAPKIEASLFGTCILQRWVEAQEPSGLGAYRRFKIRASKLAKLFVTIFEWM